MKTKEELNELKKEYEALRNKLQELSEDELNEISGGTGKDRKLCVSVDIPSFSCDVTIKVYLDGELLSDKTRTVDCSTTRINIIVSGKGSKDLRVKFNDEITKRYVVDFDSYEVTPID